MSSTSGGPPSSDGMAKHSGGYAIASHTVSICREALYRGRQPFEMKACVLIVRSQHLWVTADLLQWLKLADAPVALAHDASIASAGEAHRNQAVRERAARVYPSAAHVPVVDGRTESQPNVFRLVARDVNCLCSPPSSFNFEMNPIESTNWCCSVTHMTEWV